MRLTIVIILFFVATTSYGQTQGVHPFDARRMIEENVNRAGAIYLEYPTDSLHNSAPPKGYKAFYISHYGRHGSRYLLDESNYSHPLKILRQARDSMALTERGVQVLIDLEKIYAEAQQRAGDLSAKGRLEHRGIAERMYKNFPTVFSHGCFVDAKATTVFRCILSMSFFCERLKELDPSLPIQKDVSKRWMYYMNHRSHETDSIVANGEWRKGYSEFVRKYTPDGHHQCELLFSDTAFVNHNINAEKLSNELFWLAANMQNIEYKANFWDLFTQDEIYNHFSIFNFYIYVHSCSHPMNDGLPAKDARNLLQNMITTAENVIADGRHGATLRFGHDTNIFGLTALMKLDHCADLVYNPEDIRYHFATFYTSPMGANVQMIFYKNKTGDILVKVLHNERDTHIEGLTAVDEYFYHWDDVRDYYNSLLND